MRAPVPVFPVNGHYPQPVVGLFFFLFAMTYQEAFLRTSLTPPDFTSVTRLYKLSS